MATDRYNSGYPGDLVLPFIFVPQGEPERLEVAEFKTRYPDWFSIPSTFTPYPDQEEARDEAPRVGTADALDGEGSGIMVDTDADPAGIGRKVPRVRPLAGPRTGSDAVWHRLAEFGDLEVMHPHRLWLAFRPQFAATILGVPDKLLLLGIDRDGGLPVGLEHLDPCVDVVELWLAG